MAYASYSSIGVLYWDINTLDWIKGTQPLLEAGTVTIPGSVTVTGTVTASGPLTDAQLRASDVKISLD